MEVTCRGPGLDGLYTTNIEQKQVLSDSRWSDWSATCSLGSAVCSLMTRVQPSQGSSDDGGLTDARLQCCEY